MRYITKPTTEDLFRIYPIGHIRMDSKFHEQVKSIKAIIGMVNTGLEAAGIDRDNEAKTIADEIDPSDMAKTREALERGARRQAEANPFIKLSEEVGAKSLRSFLSKASRNLSAMDDETWRKLAMAQVVHMEWASASRRGPRLPGPLGMIMGVKPMPVALPEMLIDLLHTCAEMALIRARPEVRFFPGMYVSWTVVNLEAVFIVGYKRYDEDGNAEHVDAEGRALTAEEFTKNSDRIVDDFGKVDPLADASMTIY